MKSSVKLGEHVEDPRGKVCLDRISSLPDELLGHVLSFLPTRCAVRTSILSPRWRYIFTLSSCLSFDDDEQCFGGPTGCRQIDTARKESFREFVYCVLELHQISPIKKFSLVCGATYDKSDLNAWVTNVVQKGAQEIHYKVYEQVDVPNDLVMCETLVTLKMVSVGYYGIKIPPSVGLPNLNILHLDNLTFASCDSLQRLLSGCKSLKELTLVGCDCFESDTGYHVIISAEFLKVLTIEHCYFETVLIEIDAPNLAYLTYVCNKGIKIVPSWKNSCSLVKAELMFHCRGEDSDYSSVEYEREIFNAAAYKTTELRLYDNSVEALLKLADQEKMPDFHSLSKLHISYFPYDSWKYVTNLVDKSPRLETIIFEWGLHRCFRDPTSPLYERLFPFSCHVHVIEVRNFCGHEGSLLLLGHLLKNASLLKKLIIHKCRLNNEEDELQISKDDLLMLPRASSDCCIELI